MPRFQAALSLPYQSSPTSQTGRGLLFFKADGHAWARDAGGNEFDLTKAYGLTAADITNGTFSGTAYTAPGIWTFTGGIQMTGVTPGLEIGAVGTSNSPYMDWHSSASSTDFDVRLQASGGTAATGAGTLTLSAASFLVNSALTVQDNNIKVGGSVSTWGYTLVQPGDGTHSGTVGFYSFTGGTRQGYIGYSTTNASQDTGTLNYVAGTHAFTGAVSVTGQVSHGTASLAGVSHMFYNNGAASTVTLSSDATGGVGPQIAFLDTKSGQATPNKYIRSNAGSLQFLNSAYGAVISSMDDAGAWSVGYLTAGTGVVVNGATGATAASRYRGGTVSGAPTTGTHLTGDVVFSQNGAIWICTVGGSPGTWVNAATASPVTSVAGRTGIVTLTAADIGAGTFAAGSYTFPGGLKAGQNAAASYVYANGAAGQAKGFGMMSAGNLRWLINSTSTAEGGSNAGSNLALTGIADDGLTVLGDYLTVTRSTGAVTLGGTLASGALTVTGTGSTTSDFTAGGSLYARSAVYALSATPSTGYGALVVGSGSVSGYVGFWTPNGNRAGYIGNVGGTPATDAGTVTYVAGQHAFSSAVTGTSVVAITAPTTANYPALAISAGGAGWGSIIAMYDTTASQATPNKYMGSQGGAFKIANNALGTILTLTDAGALSVPSDITAGASVIAGNGVVQAKSSTANTGYVQLNNGNTTNAGYIAFYGSAASPQRHGYIGYGAGNPGSIDQGTINYAAYNHYFSNMTSGGSQVSTITLAADSTSARGPELALHDTKSGQATPDKYIRSNGGNLQFVNNAYSVVIATLTDAGLFACYGVNSYGDIVAQDAISPTRTYRERMSASGAVNLEAGAADIYLSTWTNTGFSTGQVLGMSINRSGINVTYGDFQCNQNFDATSGSPVQNSKQVGFATSYWNGSAAVREVATLAGQRLTSGTSAGELVISASAPLNLQNVTAPTKNASSGALIYSESGKVKTRDSSGNVSRMDNTEPHTMSVSGTLTVQTGKSRIYMLDNYVIESVVAGINTAPTGASVIVDVNKNGTTIFSTQGNRPTISVSTNMSSTNAPNTTSLASGDYLTVDVDQIGSTVAGADLTVTIRLRRV